MVALQPQLSNGFKENYYFVVYHGFLSHYSGGRDALSSFLHPDQTPHYSVIRSLEMVVFCVVVYLIQHTVGSFVSFVFQFFSGLLLNFNFIS